MNNLKKINELDKLLVVASSLLDRFQAALEAEKKSSTELQRALLKQARKNSKLKGQINKLSAETVYFIKKYMQLGKQNKELKDLLERWVEVTDNQGKHLATIVLKQETEEFLKEGD